jgi:coniferyl-aldehyde dehydrogenase
METAVEKSSASVAPASSKSTDAAETAVGTDAEFIEAKTAEKPQAAPKQISLADAFAAMHAKSRSAKSPTLEERTEHLAKLDSAIRRNQDEFVRAIGEDFGARSKHETLGAEIFIVLSSIKHAREHLPDWMHPEARPVDMAFFPARAEVLAQPVGVVGIVAPWNYPMQLALAPLVGALAAGNRALIKPSEFTPATSALLARMIADTFATDHVAVIVGDAELGAEFTRLPFDHLVFTGSTRVGKIVMRAAAENLTPVTLELGGKSPVIVGERFPIDTAAERVLYGKLLNAGQTCIAPDYVLVPEAKVEAFVKACKKAVAQLWPTLEKNADYTAIITEKHRARLESLVTDATAKGAVATQLNPANESWDTGTKKLCPTLLTGLTGEMLVMEEEIFGPILPIIPYKTLGDAIAYVNDRPRPLALYLFEYDDECVDRVLGETVSGGVSVNETMLHIAQEALPFGGIGPSGIGHYHGHEGFKTFSKMKPVFHQSRLNAMGFLRPPYTGKTDMVLKVIMNL